MNVDKWSFFETIGILKEDFGYGDQPLRLWWKGGDDEYKEITIDSHALELSNYVILNSCEVELFVECDNSDELVKAVQLDDSKEENAIGLDDGFDLPIPEIGRLENKRIKRSTIKKRPVDKACGGKKATGGGKKAPGRGKKVEHNYVNVSGSLFVTPTLPEDDIEDWYVSEQLCSDDSDEEKLGLEFSSLKEFKETILEYNVLNGREIRFNFNDKRQAREKCKHYNNYLVSQSDTYRLNTYILNTHVGGSSIIQMLSLPGWPKTKQLSKQIVDGDCIKQYSQLWSYVVELKDRYLNNSCLIRVEGPSIEVLPRFGSFYMCLEGPKSTLKKACQPLIGVDGCHL
ncbi:hypothetical protein HKD37_12G033581 [Glycine soja]